jgi:hypothetical protein
MIHWSGSRTGCCRNPKGRGAHDPCQYRPRLLGQHPWTVALGSLLPFATPLTAAPLQPGAVGVTQGWPGYCLHKKHLSWGVYKFPFRVLDMGHERCRSLHTQASNFLTVLAGPRQAGGTNITNSLPEHKSCVCKHECRVFTWLPSFPSWTK